MNPDLPDPQPPALRLLIVDDEPLARLRLRQLIGQCADPSSDLPPVDIVEAGHAPLAQELLRTRRFDALLLDIRMPGMDGLALARELRARPGSPAVVFVTAHDRHAVEAFELQALDYLTKPVQRARLREALRRVAAALGVSGEPRAPAPVAAEPAPAGVLCVTERQRSLRLPVAEIVWARAGDKQVTLYGLSGQWVVDESLAELEARLGPGFQRVHRNALVARGAMRELQRRPAPDGGEEGWALRLAPGEHWVPVSRRLVASVREAMAGR